MSMDMVYKSHLLIPKEEEERRKKKTPKKMKIMASRNKLIHIIFLTWVTAVASQVIRPDCEEMCGNVSIPYPFGTREDCYLNEYFLITCNHDFTPPKPFLRKGDIEVIDISLLEGELTIHTSVSSDCYNEKGELSGRVDDSISGLPFPLSTTRNKFTAVGCDTYAIMWGRILSTGCVLGCSARGKDTVTNGSCAGIGCCQTSIPHNFNDYKVRVFSFANHTKVWKFNPCGYAFVVEEESFNFTTADLKDLQNRTRVRSVLDWAVGKQTCEQARNNSTTSFACNPRSHCIEAHNGPGYRCNCSTGYYGNPYLPHGCQDIDECEESLHDCEKKEYCHNIEGNYTCSCPKGYHGDGRKEGERCTANQSIGIKVAAGVSISGGSLLLLLGGFWLYKVIRKMRKIKLKKRFFKRNGGLLLQQQMSSNEGTIEKTKIFTSKELEKATDNFNQNRILGQGGQGTVYKGMLTDGRIVAIKKSKLVDESQSEQFINEVFILSQINHRNVVNLLGCCLETNVPLLVYEFVSNGNLFELIHDQNDEFPFSWEMRLQIATEVAGAVAYLHSASSIPIYHRDIKSTNILLDDKYRAKVADFGTSRSISIEQTHLTTLVHGTFGYLDPEYFQSSQFTEKSDVYSFGVVLAELLTGQKPISTIRSQEDKSLATYFILSLKENCLFDILDARVMKEGRKKEIRAVANIAKRCLNLNGKKRPTMKEVTIELEAIRSSLMPLNSQQNFEEDEYIFELTGPMDGVSVSVSSFSDHTGASSSDVHPLLYNKV